MNRLLSAARGARFASRSRAQGGQVLVVFALSLVAIVAMTGLVIDGGATFVQRRDMQNVADAAAMAAGYSYSLDSDTDNARTAARGTAASNGYIHGSGGVTVDVTWDAPGGAGRHFIVTITKPHQNSFAGVIGMSSWAVTTTATVEGGWPNAVTGAMPIIFNQLAFDGNGAGPGNDRWYAEPDPGAEDVPKDALKFNWTMYCDSCNADSSTVDDLINGGGETQTVSLDDKISPLNAGAHSTLFSDLSKWIGKEFSVPVVDDSGLMVGWATFHLTGSVGGSTKQIKGYFVSPVNPYAMTVVDGGRAGGNVGSYSVKLVN
jgi:Flp pilus assembly protein TadG